MQFLVADAIDHTKPILNSYLGLVLYSYNILAFR